MLGGYQHQVIPVDLGFFLSQLSLIQVYIVITSRTNQGLYLRWAEFLQCLHSTWSSSPLKIKFLNKQYLHSSSQIRLFVLGAYLSSTSTLCHPRLGHVSLPLGLMGTFLEFVEIPLMPPMVTVVDYGILYLARTGGDGLMEVGDVH